MGITIHYRGTVSDVDRVEDMEDRLVDMALDFGGQARIWRSHSKEQPDRIVRGVILSLSPGHESLSPARLAGRLACRAVRNRGRRRRTTDGDTAVVLLQDPVRNGGKRTSR